MFDWIKAKKAPANAASAGKPTKDDLIREAMQNSRVAREAIGEETLSRVRELIQQKQAPPPKPVSPMDQARKILKELDTERLTDNLRALRDETTTH